MTRVERHYPCNMNILCVIGMSEDMVRQISDLTNMLKKTQVVVDNGTKIDEVYKRLGVARSKHALFIVETHTFDADGGSSTRVF